MKSWLDEHVFTGKEDLEFITKSIAENKAVAERAAAETATQVKHLSSSSSTNWIGKFPKLVLIHALVNHDETKKAFITCHDLTGGHMAIENRNSEEEKAPAVWQLLANKWNDQLCFPVPLPLPELHSEFSHPIPLSFVTK